MPAERLPAAVEAAAYFVVAEALTNVAKLRRGRARAAVERRARQRPRSSVEVRDDGVGGADPATGSGLRGLADRVAALDGRLERRQPAGRRHHRARGDPVRVVDRRRLGPAARGRRPPARGGRASRSSARPATPRTCCARSRAHKPDVAVVDVRMPPTHTDEGLRAALRDPRRAARRSACSCSRSTSRRPTRCELLADDAEGVGYLLKDRVADVDDFVDAVRRVADGGSALDPEVVSQLLGRRRARRPARRAHAARARGARR